MKRGIWLSRLSELQLDNLNDFREVSFNIFQQDKHFFFFQYCWLTELSLAHSHIFIQTFAQKFCEQTAVTEKFANLLQMTDLVVTAPVRVKLFFPRTWESVTFHIIFQERSLEFRRNNSIADQSAGSTFEEQTCFL